MSVVFDPLNSFYKSVRGAVKQNEKVLFRVKGDFDSVFFVLRREKDGVTCEYELEKKDGYFELSASFPIVGLYFYRFRTPYSYIGLGSNYKGVVGDDPEEFQLSVYGDNYETPGWLKGGIIYQIFPDRFNGDIKNKILPSGKVAVKDKNRLPTFLPDENGEVLNNEFYGGDLKGIREKIPYLKSLNVTAIYLNPIFEAYSNHRYDTGDYLKIDPVLGTEEDLKNLIAACKDNGIGVILDGVFNHTGSDSRYFNKKGTYDSLGAYQSKKSPYYSWYKFIDYPSDYESWWGIKTLPATDKESSGFTDFIAGEQGVIEKYTKLGVKGWRLDVVDELPSAFVRKIRSAIKKCDKDAVMIGEVWEDASNKISYGIRREYFLGEELDSAMNYPLKDGIVEYLYSGNAEKFSLTLKTLLDHYPKCSLDLSMNILSTHDTARILSKLSGVNTFGLNKTQMSEIVLDKETLELARARVMIASVLEFTLPGVPSVYYGDEAGMQGFFDPYNRAFFPWGKEDKKLFAHYKKLGEIRSVYSAFKSGDCIEVAAFNGVYAFKRTDENSELLIVVNSGEKSETLEFDGELYDLLYDKSHVGQIEVKPLSAHILISKA